MDVYWLEQTEADVPTDVAEKDDWLSVSEVTFLRGLRFAKRRTDWRLGRWTAKRAVALWFGMSGRPEILAQIELRPAPSGAPEVFIANKAADPAVSLTHRSGRAACALAPSGVALGCDLEMIEPHSDAFISDYFTLEEQTLVARARVTDRPCLLALLWSAKESALKALHEGLRRDTRSVVVTPFDGSPDLNGWARLRVRSTDGQVFQGWWQRTDGMVRTLVATPPPNPPIQLRISDYVPDTASQCA
jgi:phosphopantetheinyl transferase